MQGKSADSKEYRARVAALPDDLRQHGGDPFAVEVKPILKRLRSDFGNLDAGEMVADAQAVNAVSKIVSLQDQWLSFQLTSFQVDPDLLVSKVRATSLLRLAESISDAHHPISSIRQMPTARLLEAADYWVQLYGLGRAAEMGPLGAAVVDESAFESIRMEPHELERRLEEMLAAVTRRLATGPLPYRAFLAEYDGATRLEKAYLLAHLCMRGAFTMRYDPSISDYVMQESEGSVEKSVAVSLG